MNSRRIGSLVRKDIREVLASNMTLVPLIVVPLVLCVFVPVILMIAGFAFDIALIQGAQFLEQTIPLYSLPDVLDGATQKIMYIFLNYTFVPFFMIIPLMISSIIAANSFVGEKERGTLETLLYTPITNRELLTGKLLAALIPAIVVSTVAFILYFFIGNIVSKLMIGVLMIRSPIWIPAILLLSPATSFLGLSLTLLVSLKAKTYMEAQQTSGAIVLPFIALVVVQMTGILVLNMLYVVLFAAIVGVISYVILAKMAPRFDRESILRRM